MSASKFFVPMNQGNTLAHEGEVGRIVGVTTTGYLVDFGDGPEEISADRGNTANDENEAQTLVRAVEDAAHDRWLDSMTRQIYNIVSGADNRDEMDSIQSDIHDWLPSRSPSASETAEELAAEYIEYCETCAEATE